MNRDFGDEGDPACMPACPGRLGTIGLNEALRAWTARRDAPMYGEMRFEARR